MLNNIHYDIHINKLPRFSIGRIIAFSAQDNFNMIDRLFNASLSDEGGTMASSDVFCFINSSQELSFAAILQKESLQAKRIWSDPSVTESICDSFFNWKSSENIQQNKPVNFFAYFY